MKIIILLLVTVSFNCLGQQQLTKDSLRLTQWQEQQIITLEQQKKSIEDQYRFLLRAILDFNRIDQSKIEGINYKNGYIIISRKKD